MHIQVCYYLIIEVEKIWVQYYKISFAMGIGVALGSRREVN